MALGDLFNVVGYDDILVRSINDDRYDPIFECGSYGHSNMNGFPRQYERYLDYQVKEVTTMVDGRLCIAI